MSHADAELEARVVAAAARLAAGGRFTMEELAQAAGVSRSTLYRLVPGRAELARMVQAAGAGELGDTRGQILEAARLLCGQRGLLGWTIEQVAAEAGVAEATVYRVFGDRDALIKAMMDELSPRRAITGMMADPSAPIEPTLVAMVTEALRFARDNPLILRVIAGGKGPEMRYVRKLRKHRVSTAQLVVAYFREQVARGRLGAHAPEALAEIFGGLVLGAALLDELQDRGDRDRDLAARARRLVDVFLKGCVP